MGAEKCAGEVYMRKVTKYLGLPLLVLVLIVLVYIGVQVVQLKLWMGNKQIIVGELTKNQKEEDFTYLAMFVEEVYPFTELLHEVKGFSDISELSSDYIKRAGETKNNEEFLLLFLEYTERLRQAGHGGIQFIDFDLFTSYTFGIPKDAYLKQDYWRKLLSKVPYYVHSGLDIMYKDGTYIIIGITLPDLLDVEIGSTIQAVDGLPVDEWVKGLEAVQPLLYDEYHNKVYTQHLLMSNFDKKTDGWDVIIQLTDGSLKNIYLDKIPGYKNDTNAFSQCSHIYCEKLQDNVGYVYIPNFFLENINTDGRILADFMHINGKDLDKLIIDTRGNQGGENTYWLNIIVRPLLKHEVELHSKTAVKKSFESRMKLRLDFYRATASNHLLHKSHYVSSVSTVEEPSLDSNIWNVYDITQKVSPANSYNFNGEITILIDSNCMSAGDSFASTMKQLGLARLVGNPTGGWGNHYLSPVLFSLPNSGLCFRSDVELSYNVDDRPTSIYGTMPDVFLTQNPYPSELSKEVLVKDDWISWSLNH